MVFDAADHNLGFYEPMEGIFEGFNNPTNEPSNEEAELVDSALASMVEVIKIVKKHTLTDCPGENFILWKLDLSFCVSVRIHLVIRTCTFVCLHSISPPESEVDSLSVTEKINISDRLSDHHL